MNIFRLRKFLKYLSDNNFTKPEWHGIYSEVYCDIQKLEGILSRLDTGIFCELDLEFNRIYSQYGV